MKQTDTKGFYQSAMQYGTYLGIYWAVMYILLFRSLYNPMLSTIAVAMVFTSPLLAYRFTIGYRKKECGDQIKYPQAWTFLFCMYICATLFSALTNYIFFNFMDQGAFLMEFNDILSQLIATPDIDSATKAQFEGVQDMLSQTTVNGIMWQLLNNNIFNPLILPPIIALFARKKI